MRDVILNQAEQITHSLEVNQDVRAAGDFDSIVFAGLGGSGHPGDLINALGLTTIPLTVWRSYNLPRIFGQKPLVIASSYSGNTEETMSAYKAAREKNYALLVNTAGGTLAQWSERDTVPWTKIDFANMQPRHTLFASFTGVVKALINSGLAEDIPADLQRTAKVLAASISSLEDPGKALAQKLKGKIPLIYASERLAFAAQNFKIQINENVKAPAFWNFFPEFNHNELVGTSHSKDAVPTASFHALIIRDSDDHPRNRARMDVTKGLYEQWGVPVTVFDVVGETLLEKIFYSVIFGLWTTYYLAGEYGIDPVPVEGVESFKAKLKEIAG